MSLTFIRTIAGISTAAALCLCGCSRHEAAQAPSTAAPPTAAAVAAVAPVDSEAAVEVSHIDKALAADLMQAIFGADYRPEEGVAVAAIEGNEEADYWRMTLYSAKVLADGRTAVVVNGAPSDEDGGDSSSHASSGMLNVYTLKRTDGAWRVLTRRQNVSAMGSSGNIGVIKWITLAEGRTGIIVSSGGTWFGSTIADAEVFDLDSGMRSLGSFAELSSNEGNCGPETTDCWDVEGKIGSVPAAQAKDYRDILVAFSGKHFRVTEDARGKQVEHVTRTVRQSARYRFNGKAYVLVSGVNPVPAIDG